MHRVCRTFAFAMIHEGNPIECTADVTLAARQRPDLLYTDPDMRAEPMFSHEVARIVGELINRRINGYDTGGLCQIATAENMAETVYAHVASLTREARRKTAWQLHVEAVRITIPGVGWAESSWSPLEP